MSFLPCSYIAGVVGGSLGLNVLFHCIRRARVFTTEKQLAWVLTLTTCIIVSFGSMLYVVPSLYNNLHIPELVQTDTLSLVLCGIFTSYLMWDLILGLLFYKSTIRLLTGYFHHTFYIFITLYAIYRNVPAILCLLFYNELPTIVLALGCLRNEWRNDGMFIVVFFVTRIAVHGVLMKKFYEESELRFVWPLMLVVFPMHVYWLFSAVRSWAGKGSKSLP